MNDHPETSPTRSFSEVTVTVKDEERSLKEKFLVYENYEVNEHHPILRSFIDKVIKEFNGEPTDIKVKISLVVL